MMTRSTLRDAQRRKSIRARRNLGKKLAESEAFDRPGDRTVVYQRYLVRPAILDMAIEGVVAGVDFAPDKPPIERLPRIIEDRVPLFVPVNIFSRFGPELLGLFERAGVEFIVSADIHGANRLRA